MRGSEFTVTYGRIGVKGQTQTKSFANAAKALVAHDRLVAEKVGKGYVETTAGVSTAPLTGKVFENAILADPEDLATRSPTRTGCTNKKTRAVSSYSSNWRSKTSR